MEPLKMGCDIHMLVEARNRCYLREGAPAASEAEAVANAQARLTGWYPWRVVMGHEVCPTFRDYALFAKLAGVRNDDDSMCEPISEPRGLPSDASPEAVEFFGGPDLDFFHDCSWLTLQEAREGLGREPHLADSLYVKWLDSIMSVTRSKLDEVRIVFAFDN